jgi:hypothetical protein
MIGIDYGWSADMIKTITSRRTFLMGIGPLIVTLTPISNFIALASDPTYLSLF